MATKYFEIEKALFDAVRVVDAVTPISWPNHDLKDSEKPADGLWLKVSNLRAKTNAGSLGEAGQDDHRGILQIDINYPLDKGEKVLIDKGDDFASYFTAGKALSYNGQTVTVLAPSLSAGRFVGGYYRISVSIPYYARTTRA